MPSIQYAYALAALVLLPSPFFCSRYFCFPVSVLLGLYLNVKIIDQSGFWVSLQIKSASSAQFPYIMEDWPCSVRITTYHTICLVLWKLKVAYLVCSDFLWTRLEQAGVSVAFVQMICRTWTTLLYLPLSSLTFSVNWSKLKASPPHTELQNNCMQTFRCIGNNSRLHQDNWFALWALINIKGHNPE